MTITSFNPLIVTKDAASVIALFEALGFERRHTKTGINDDVTSVRMKYTGEDGKEFRVSISEAPVPRDITSIRMNVRDFDDVRRVADGPVVEHGGGSPADDLDDGGYGGFVEGGDIAVEDRDAQDARLVRRGLAGDRFAVGL